MKFFREEKVLLSSAEAWQRIQVPDPKPETGGCSPLSTLVDGALGSEKEDPLKGPP
jgi:hypothetical protein